MPIVATFIPCDKNLQIGALIRYNGAFHEVKKVGRRFVQIKEIETGKGGVQYNMYLPINMRLVVATVGGATH